MMFEQDTVYSFIYTPMGSDYAPYKCIGKHIATKDTSVLIEIIYNEFGLTYGTTYSFYIDGISNVKQLDIDMGELG